MCTPQICPDWRAFSRKEKYSQRFLCVNESQFASHWMTNLIKLVCVNRLILFKLFSCALGDVDSNLCVCVCVCVFWGLGGRSCD